MKKSLCLSESSYEAHLKQLDQCTIAVAFLGTPHRGSELASFAAGITNALRACGMRVNNRILQVLQRDSDILADVEDSFMIWLRKKGDRFNLTCFYEELELPAVGMACLIHYCSTWNFV